MPCYSAITTSVVFKIENIELLKKALAMNTEYYVYGETATSISFQNKARDSFKIDLNNGQISSSISKEQLTSISNSLKRAYSQQVINEVARKQKWMVKEMGQNRYQLQRF